MTSHTILLEILKILLVAIFLFAFVSVFKKVIRIGKFANGFLMEHYLLDEKYRKEVVKKTMLKFIKVIAFDEEAIKLYICELIYTPEFINNVKTLKEDNKETNSIE